MPINIHSDYLTILVATYNRLDALKVAIDAIHAQTRCSHEVIVIDGGSTDGTIEYLKSHSDITPVFQGRLLGVPRSYNEVWRQVKSKYTCWLSDDTELTNHGIDLAVEILEKDSGIGMVGLKTKDVIGPRIDKPYVGALSEYQILNFNHGVMPFELVRSIGFFNEDYPMYMVDPDLTASILCTGKKVVMTKPVCVLHCPEWAVSGRSEKKTARFKGVDHFDIYRQKFSFLTGRLFSERIVRRARYMLRNPFIVSAFSRALKLNSRDIKNLRDARFISPFDSVKTIRKPYHNVQQIPYPLLIRENNPYRHLVESDGGKLK
jgi:GT2 family glycosyltransferase